MYDLVRTEQDEELTKISWKPMETPWYRGALAAPWEGLKHGAAVTYAVYQESGDDELKKEEARKWVRETRVDSTKQGAVAQILSGLTQMIPEAIPGVIGGGITGAGIGAAGGAVAGGVGAGPGAIAGARYGAQAGAVASVSYATAYDKFMELRDQGVDIETAAQVSGISGAAMGIGMILPGALGGTLAKQVTSGAAMNVAVGGAERALSGEVLEQKGYNKIAQNYKFLDAQSMALDAILGAAFPLAGRLIGGKPVDEMQRPTVEQTDAAMTQVQKNAELTRNPGLETTDAGSIRTKEALDLVDEQLIVEGKPWTEIETAKVDDWEPNPSFGRALRLGDEAVDSHFIRSLDESVEAFYRDNEIVRSIDDAFQKRSTEEVDVREQARDGKAMAKRDSGQEVAGTRRPEEEVSNFKRNEIDGLAKMMPDAEVTLLDNTRIKLKDFAEYERKLLAEGEKDAYLHASYVTCMLNHGI